MDYDKRLAWAQFRFSVIAPLVCRKIKSEEDRRTLRRDIINQIYVTPDGHQKKVSERTLNDWLWRYKRDGFEGLFDMYRKTKGACRALPKELVDRAEKLRREEPSRSIRTIISILKAEGFDTSSVSKSTLNFHLNRRGAKKGKLAGELGAFQRWEQKYANALWQADTSSGLWLPDPANPKKVKRTKLISFIDDASRVCTHAQFYWDEKLPSLVDCFRRALLKRGRPERLLCDNAFIYHSNTINLMCAQLRIEVSFCKEYSPEGKGKIEKHYGTIKNSFYTEAEHAGIITLDDLNQFFWAWLTKEYHHTKHSSLKITPIERWRKDEHLLHRVSPEDIRRALMLRVHRKVNERTAQIRLENNYYQADSQLAGLKVEVRWHADDEEEIEIWQHGKPIDIAQRTNPDTNIDFSRKPERKLTKKGLPYESSKAYRLALIREHEGESPVAPSTPDNYLTESEFVSLVAATLQKNLAPEEVSILNQFFFECSPLRTTKTTVLLQQGVNAKGSSLHLRYYLDHIRRTTFKNRR